MKTDHELTPEEQASEIASNYYEPSSGAYERLRQEIDDIIQIKDNHIQNLKNSLKTLAEAVKAAEPKIGAWDSTCYMCNTHTPVGDIPHKPGCPISVAKLVSSLL